MDTRTASTLELLLDYEDYHRTRGRRQWEDGNLSFQSCLYASSATNFYLVCLL